MPVSVRTLAERQIGSLWGEGETKTGAHAAAARWREVMFQKLLAGCLLSHIHAIKCRVFQTLFLPLP